MVKLFTMLLGIAATFLSFNLPAYDSVPRLALAETHAYVQPAVAVVTLPPAQVDLDSTNSPNSADGAPNAWLCALGFLGLVVLRRTRSGPMA
jgi:hypothetical protein